MSSSEASTRRRVKLYMLNDERQWDDKGTGHVSAICTEQDTMALVVISETDGSYLLESKILPDTAYQKQQETLIVWSEGENMDLALSFQEKVGCDDVWEKICAVQGKDPSVEITQEVVDEPDDTDENDGYAPILVQSVQPLILPPCESKHLEETVALITEAVSTPMKREKLVALLESTNYLNQLIDWFHKVEDSKELKSLHHFYEIARQLILLNKHSLYDIFFADDTIMDIIGMLEYCPSGRKHHRDFLLKKATFREVLPLHNPELINKIHQTYRVQYIQECCLPPPCLFDEHSLAQLKSFISLNKLEIIRNLQDDEEFMCHLFDTLKSPDTELAHRKELSMFVKEFCSISIQSEQKESFLTCMIQHGALKAAEVLLLFDDKDIKSAAMEILQALVENQPSVVRSYVYRETAPIRKDDELLINVIIQQLVADTDPELSDAFLMGCALRILIDPDNMNNPGVRGEKTEFLSFFYKRCINTLVRPLFDNTVKDQMEKDDYHTALVLNHVLELLTFCIETHTYHMKNYCFNRDLLKRVLVLLQSSHKFLVLTALRLLRRVIHMKEEFYNRYLIKNDLFKPVIKLFVNNGSRYNLVDSAIIELFDYIRSEEITSLITHVVENFWDLLKNINYVQTFNDLKRAYDHTHRPTRPVIGAIGQQSGLEALSLVNVSATRFQRDPRALEIEEEQWFDQDDEDDEEEDEEHSLYNPPPSSALITGVLNGTSSPVLTNAPTRDALSSVSHYDNIPGVASAATTSPPDFLNLPALTASQSSMFSLESVNTSDPRDSIFPMALSHPISSTSLSNAVDTTQVPPLSRVLQDRIRFRQSESDIDSPRPPLLRHTAPISIHIKSASSISSKTPSEEHALTSQKEIPRLSIAEQLEGAECRETNHSPIFVNQCSNEGDFTPELFSADKRIASISSDDNPEPIKKPRTSSPSESSNAETLLDSAATVSSISPLEPTAVDSSVGLVDYSDEESENDDEESLDVKPKTPEDPGLTVEESLPSVAPTSSDNIEAHPCLESPKAT